jgi:hypothetical protein
MKIIDVLTRSRKERQQAQYKTQMAHYKDLDVESRRLTEQANISDRVHGLTEEIGRAGEDSSR